MGVFSSKETVVSSTIYNMAGPVATRPDFLATTIAGGVLAPNSDRVSLGDRLIDGLFTGPAMDQRKLYQWAKSHFPIGMPQARIVHLKSTLGTDISSEIPAPVGYTVEMLSSTIEGANYTYWAERHVLEMYPGLTTADWTSLFDEPTNSITIVFLDTTSEVILADGFDASGEYLYAYYHLVPDDPMAATETRLFIYRIGSGNATLDALAQTGISAPGEFYPFIPLRMWNKSIRHTQYTETQPIFSACKKAFRKATAGSQRIDKLLDQIEDHEDIGDIDFCFLVYGVPLNTQDKHGKRYIFEFFRQLIPYQEANVAAFEAWASATDSFGRHVGHPPSTTIHLRSSEAVTKAYNVRIHWGSIEETLHEGTAKPGAAVGDVWIEPGTPLTYTEYVGEGDAPIERTLDVIEITFQQSVSSYRRLRVLGLIHTNHVYGSESITTRATATLDDEDESGFVVPMHYPTVRKLSLVGVTQASMGNSILVFNSYEVVKKKWYQSGFFGVIITIIVAVIMAVITFYFPVAGFATGGILGTNAAIGASLGLTGLTAAIVGSVLNAMAAMILTMMITEVAKSAFGEALGGILGVLASFVAMTYLSTFQATGSWAVNWGDMMTAENLLKITDVAARGASSFIQGRAGEMQADLEKLGTRYESQMNEIERRTEQLLGYSGVLLNPLMFTEIGDNSALRSESSETFLTRSLLTGSDIAEMTLSMIGEFPRATLELPPYTM